MKNYFELLSLLMKYQGALLQKWDHTHLEINAVAIVNDNRVAHTHCINLIEMSSAIEPSIVFDDVYNRLLSEFKEYIRSN